MWKPSRKRTRNAFLSTPARHETAKTLDVGSSFLTDMSRIVQTPAARAADPTSSHLAADTLTRSGRRETLREQAIDAVRTHPGCTASELAARTGLHRYMLSRRLPEAVTAGAVRKGPSMVCTETGYPAVTWWPAGAIPRNARPQAGSATAGQAPRRSRG